MLGGENKQSQLFLQTQDGAHASDISINNLKAGLFSCVVQNGNYLYLKTSQEEFL